VRVVGDDEIGYRRNGEGITLARGGGGSEGWTTSEKREEAELKPANEWTVKPTTPCDAQRAVQPIVQYGPFHRAPLKKKWLLFLLVLVD
jgi:hypothetical protein